MTKPPMTGENELLACPFCGALPDKAFDEGGGRVWCANFDCLQPAVHCPSADEAVAFWNTRPTPALPEEEESERVRNRLWCRAAEALRREGLEKGLGTILPDEEAVERLARRFYESAPKPSADAVQVPWEEAQTCFSTFVADCRRTARIALSIPSTEGLREALVEALTPSGDTKATYHGEFSFTIEDADEEGEPVSRKIYVPWTTVKEIMAAIRDRAALRASPNGMTEEGR